MNPFVSLFLVPVALATLALPIHHIVLAILAATGTRWRLRSARCCTAWPAPSTCAGAWR
jgi:hypothetical protein